MTSLTRRERDDLTKLARHRERLAKAMAAHRASELLADFEARIATEYAWDDDTVWREAYRAAADATTRADAAIDARCAELGIPKAFRPRLSPPYWFGRFENGVAKRRAELRKVAQTRIAERERDAKVRIEAASLAIQTSLLADGLTSDAARRFLDAMPTPEALMPPLTLGEVTDVVPAGRLSSATCSASGGAE